MLRISKRLLLSPRALIISLISIKRDNISRWNLQFPLVHPESIARCAEDTASPAAGPQQLSVYSGS